MLNVVNTCMQRLKYGVIGGRNHGDATKKQPKVVLKRYETEFVASLSWHLGKVLLCFFQGLNLELLTTMELASWGTCCYAFARVGTWNFLQLSSWHLGEGVVMLLLCFWLGRNLKLLTTIEEGVTRMLMFRVWLCEEGGTWSKGFEINYLITMIEHGRFFVELSQHFFFLKEGGKKKGSSNKKQETLKTQN